LLNNLYIINNNNNIEDSDNDKKYMNDYNLG